MPWSDLAFQFCMELAFGVLLALAFVPKAPVGTMFYRVMGTSALVPVLAGLGISLSVGSLAPSSPIVVAGALVVLTYPVYSGPVRGARWAFGLGVAVLGCVVAVMLTIRAAAPELGVLQLALATTTALATGAVAGSVGLAMVLGHWYLTVPNLQIGHLRRLNRVTVGAMLGSIVFVGLSCLVFDELLNAGNLPLFEATGLFYLGTRLTVGLAVPLLFAAMTASSLKAQNTRSATGILYASTVLVLIGTAVSVSLQDSYGVPL
jgi:hypothetical protein